MMKQAKEEMGLKDDVPNGSEAKLQASFVVDSDDE